MKGRTVKQTDIGTIPEEWSVSSIGNILEGPTRNGIYKPEEFHGSGVKIINMGELFAYPRIGQPPMERVRLDASEIERFSVRDGDLLFARRSLVAEGAGKCSLVVGEGETRVFESSIIRARPDPSKADSRYLFYLFGSSYGQYLMGTILRQVAVAGITGSDLITLQVPLPPLGEQKSIARVLGALDDKAELDATLDRTLEAMARAVFKHWFIDFEFPNEEGKPYKSSGGEMVYNEELGKQIPKGWKAGSILDCANILSGGTPRTEVAEYWGGEIPWVSARDVTNSQGSFIVDTQRTITQAGIDNSNAKLLPEKTTVVTARGVVGSYCILSKEMAINQTNYGLKARSEAGDYFVFFSIANLVHQMKQHSYGTIFDTITTTTFASMKIPIPPSSLIQSFEEQAKAIMTKILVSLQEAHNLASLRDALLPKLMSGKIRVPVEGR